MNKAIPLLAASLLLFSIFSGCTMPWDKPQAKPVDSGAQPYQPQQDQSQPPQQNQTQPPVYPLQSGQIVPNSSNYTPPPALPPEEPVQLRSMSDKIYEGAFSVPEPIVDPLRVHFIKAGFADSILVNKGAFNILIDDGNAELVHAYLRSAGITRLDIVVATHDEPDAVSGVSSLIDEFEIGEIWEGWPSKQSDDYIAMLDKARAKEITIKHPMAGDRMRFGGLNIFVLNPPKDKEYNSNPEVDAIVLKVTNNQFCMVLLNPTVQECEPALISAANAANESLRCDVAAYFRHGEGRPTPPSIMEYINPRDVIISVGQNDEKLPSPTTLAYLSVHGKTVHQTDHGTQVLTNYGFRAYEFGR